jgi:exopolyphosphatase/guanosine-5'-triphosphate,3'-diphosphate pyrophosphatase
MKVRKYAAIDVGSNAVRMLISNVIYKDGKTFFQKNSLIRLPIRLGNDAFSNGIISTLNIKKMIRAFKAFNFLMKVHEVTSSLAYATSALREAKNKNQVIELILKKTKTKIQVISGLKEAEIISKTNIFELIDFYKTFLYVDVGGGSTELTIIHRGKKIISKSFNLGTVRILNNMVKDEIWNLFENWIKINTKLYPKIYLLGTGGNINKLHKLSGTKEGKPITYLILNALYHKLNKMSYEERIIKLGLNLDRSDVIIPALKIYMSSLKWSKSKVIYVPQVGLADGMIKVMVENSK